MAQFGRKTIKIDAPIIVTTDGTPVWMDDGKWAMDFFDWLSESKLNDKLSGLQHLQNKIKLTFVTAKSKRKFFELRNGLKAIDYRNKDYYDRIDDHEKSLYSPYMLMRYASSVSSKDQFFVEHYVEMVNECVNKHCFTLGKHKKLLWILTAMCGALQNQFHPWIKPMKRVPNKSLKQLQQIYPTWKEADLETLDNIITDRELEELIEAHGIQSK